MAWRSPTHPISPPVWRRGRARSRAAWDLIEPSSPREPASPSRNRAVFSLRSLPIAAHSLGPSAIQRPGRACYPSGQEVSARRALGETLGTTAPPTRTSRPSRVLTGLYALKLWLLSEIPFFCFRSIGDARRRLSIDWADHRIGHESRPKNTALSRKTRTVAISYSIIRTRKSVARAAMSAHRAATPITPLERSYRPRQGLLRRPSVAVKWQIEPRSATRQRRHAANRGVPQTPVAQPPFRHDQRSRWPSTPLLISHVHGLPPLADADSRWTRLSAKTTDPSEPLLFRNVFGGDDTTSRASPRVKIEGGRCVQPIWSGRVRFFRPGSQCLPTATGETLSCSKPPDAQRPDLDRTLRSPSVTIFDTC